MNWFEDWDAGWHLQWFGFEQSPEVDGYGDGGVATLVLDLENGFTVRHSWITDVIKFKSGREQRISRNDIDRESYSGSTLLSAARAREIRALLARNAAIGARFLLGLPHEGMALRDDASGTTIPVSADDLALCDWAVAGQRVVVVTRDDNDEPVATDAVVQSATSDMITLNVSAAAVYGDEIMPAKAIYLEPQQGFPRYVSGIESWQFTSRGATPLDFAPTLASAELPGIFAGLTAYAREYGLVGNVRALQVQTHPSAPPGGILLQGLLTTYRAVDGDETVADFIAAMEDSTYIRLEGAPADLNAVITGSDEFAIALEGATSSGPLGTGATITEYDGDGEDRPVWTRKINLQGTAEDGIHAMTQIIDHGGIPYALGTADKADWYRHVAIIGGDRADWQWFKLFMSTVKGCQKKFWLSTWRDDLEYVSHTGNELTIDADLGDFTAWWPSQREYIQLEQADGTITYAKITDAEDNGDGTRTLTLSVAPSASPVTRISWLELCRFENADNFTTTHGEHGFDVALVARVVP